MKTSKFLYSTLVAAAAMSLPASYGAELSTVVTMDALASAGTIESGVTLNKLYNETVYTFDGTGAILGIESSDLLSAINQDSGWLTIAAWINPDVTDTTQSIFGYGAQSDGFKFDANNQTVSVTTKGVSDISASSNLLNAGTWTLVALTINLSDGSGSRYLVGDSDFFTRNLGTWKEPSEENQTFAIGSGNSTDNRELFTGSIANLTVFTSTERATNEDVVTLMGTIPSKDYDTLAGTLTTWAGTDENSAWDTESSNWKSTSDESVAFTSGESVAFTSAATVKDVSVATSITAGSVVLTDDYSFAFSDGVTLTLSKLIGTGDLNATGSGTIRIASATGAGDYEGDISVGDGTTLYWGQNSGTSVNSTYSLGSGTVTVNAGGKLLVWLGSQKDYDTSTDGKVIISNKIVLNGSESSVATLETQDGSYYFSGGLQVGDGTNAGYGTFLARWDKAVVINGLTGSGTLTLDTANASWGSTAMHVLSGTTAFDGTLDYSGDGTLWLSGDSATITTLNLNSGTLNISGGTNTIGTLDQVNGSAATTISFSGGTTTVDTFKGAHNYWHPDSTIEVLAGASLSVTNDFIVRYEHNGTTTMNISGNVSVGGDFWLARDGKSTVNINDGGVLNANKITFGQNWPGEEKSSVLNLASGGTLILGSDGIASTANLNTSSLNLNGGTLGTSAASLVVDVDSLPVVLGDGTTTTIKTAKYENGAFGTTGSSITIANTVSGNGALKVDGTGTLTLSGSNSYTGGTTISSGTLVATSESALGTGPVTVNGTLSLGTSAVTVTNLSGDGTVRLLSGVESSTLTVNSTEDTTFSGSLTVGDMDKLDTYKLSLVKTGTGTLVLDSAASLGYGSISVEEGTLVATNDFAFGSVTAVSVSDGANVKLTGVQSGGYGLYVGSLAFESGSKLIVDFSNLTVTADADSTDSLALNILCASTITFGDTALSSETLSTDVLSEYVTFANNEALFELYKNQEWSYDGKALTLTLSIPEPSAFGLLAGLGAIALVASRRRRTKKA